MAKKIKIKENIVKWSSWELDGSLPDQIAKFQKLITDNPNHFDFNLEVESESGYYGSCSTNIIIDAWRMETDADQERRLLIEREKRKEAALNKEREEYLKDQRERQLYESLKRKFEKEIEETNPKPNHQ